MELKLQRNLVLQELSILQGVVEHRTTIPILSSILAEAGENRLRMVATDGHRLAQSQMEAPEGSAGMAGVIYLAGAAAILAIGFEPGAHLRGIPLKPFELALFAGCIGSRARLGIALAMLRQHLRHGLFHLARLALEVLARAALGFRGIGGQLDRTSLGQSDLAGRTPAVPE